MSQSVVSAGDDTFDQIVLGADKPVIVDFWAEWCGPCKMIAPMLEEIATEYADRVRVVKVNADENPGVAARYGILSMPTLLVFRGGQPIRSLVGARPKKRLVSELADVLG